MWARREGRSASPGLGPSCAQAVFAAVLAPEFFAHSTRASARGNSMRQVSPDRELHAVNLASLAKLTIKILANGDVNFDEFGKRFVAALGPAPQPSRIFTLRNFFHACAQSAARSGRAPARKHSSHADLKRKPKTRSMRATASSPSALAELHEPIGHPAAKVVDGKASSARLSQPRCSLLTRSRRFPPEATAH